MQMLRGMGMNTEVEKVWLLGVLKTNRTRHTECFEEARGGYVEHARKQLGNLLGKLKDGHIARIYVQLEPPKDHTPEYDTVIGMLENSVNDSVVLSASEYRMLVEDEWDWMSGWLQSNSGYSQAINALAIEKGVV